MPAPPVPPVPPEPGRVYAPGAFDRLELAGAARVILVQGDRDQAFIAGNDEVQKSVEVELADHQLIIRPTGGWKFWQSKTWKAPSTLSCVITRQWSPLRTIRSSSS